MSTLGDIVAATLSRLGFWADQFVDRKLTAITADAVDAVLMRVAERGRLKPIRGQETRRAGPGQHQPLYLPTRFHLQVRPPPAPFPPTFLFPSADIDRYPEPSDPER